MIFLFTILALVAAAVYCNVVWGRRKLRRMELEAIVARKRADREASIAAAKSSAAKVDVEVRDRIAVMEFAELRDGLQKGEISCLDAVRTFYHKAILANERTNSVCMFIKEAEEWAREWDEKAKEPGFVKPALFGVPFSLKECVPIEGYDQTRGFVQDTYKPTKEDSVMVAHIKKIGGIPYVQTNVPQSLLSYNCANPVFGVTNHPKDKNRTSGGSSGGESAILAADGSVLGIGGDVGGSIRIPCHFTGTAGIKPSHLRFSHRGVCGSVPGRPLINSNDGPMARDIETNVAFLREVWKDDWISQQDPYVPPVLWNEDLYKEGRKYRIGYYVDDGWFTPTPALQRSVLEAKEHLERAGHTLVPFQPPRVPEVMRLFVRAVCVDAGQYLLNKMLNDIVEPTLYAQVAMWMIPVRLQRVLAYVGSVFFPRLGNLMKALAKDTSELRECYAAIEAYRSEFTVLMLDKKIDALLCPSQVMPAPPHDIPSKLFASISYTGIFNLLDFGAGVVNATYVTKDDEEKLEAYPETDVWYKLAKKATKGTVGFPVGVQVAAPPFREEIVLRVLRDIEKAVIGH
ncbi:unnamed protein product [Caenorhabditis auriculariae]|uniref:fatty acid amide hydrolase n=1 Tax=Caenorhabditis auriculariae TaxID=2777116 RepID=A0A8S1HCA7_9PELO|nr:unnamed protein product [Caenorhabditis auriculariae]